MHPSDDIRAGMSCFRARTSGAKLAAGLACLAADIADRSIDRIIAESLNDIGDYCFIAMTPAAASGARAQRLTVGGPMIGPKTRICVFLSQA